MVNTFSETYVRERLDEARFHQFCTQADRAQTVLSPVLKHLIENRDSFSKRLSCEVLLIYGSVISYQGIVRKQEYLQENALNFLTEAQILAFDSEDLDLIAEIDKQIGICYWRIGQHENAIAYLESAMSRIAPENQSSSVAYLSAQTNMIGVKFDLKRIDESQKIVETVAPLVEASDDKWLQTIFFNEAAGIYLALTDFVKAIEFLEKAIDLATITKNKYLLAPDLNNLALVYLSLGDSATAFQYVERALDVCAEIEQPFTMAMFLETKSQILIEQNDLKAAREIIDSSILLLETSENYVALAESMWTRILIMKKSGEKLPALDEFLNLMKVVSINLSESYINSYKEKFAALFYMESDGNLYEKVHDYKRTLIDQALTASQGLVTKAAKHLGISHQNTSLLLKNNPDLCEKHNVKLRKRVTDSFLPKKGKIKKNSNGSFILRLQSNRLEYIGLGKGKIINFRLRLLTELDTTKPVIIQSSDEYYHCGFIEDALDMIALHDGRGNIDLTFIHSDIISAGQVISYYDSEQDKFVPLDN